jgi:hypothetical protein
MKVMSRRYPLALLWALLVSLLAAEVRSEEPAADAAVPDGAAKYELKYKFTPGEVMATEVVHRASVRTTIQGTTQTAETQSKSVKMWKVEGVDEAGDATFTHMVDHIEMWQKASGRQDVSYDSKTDDAVPPGYEEVARSVGVPLSVVTMDSRGTIVRRKETRANPMGVSTQMTMPLADHPIAIGESWTSPVEIDVTLKDGSQKKVQTRQKFTLESVTDGVAHIKVDSQVLTPINDPSIEAQLVQRLSSGFVKFDIEAGRVLSQQLDLDKHVIGFNGPTSSMHYVTRFTEKLLDPGEAPTSEAAASEEPASEATADRSEKKELQ